MDITQIVQVLNGPRVQPTSSTLPNTAGIYAVFVRASASSIPNFITGEKPIYVGTTNSLATRVINTHFCSGKTGFSTLRRSLGAVLKGDLGLTPIPRGKGRRDKDFVNYQFQQEGEKILTGWMMENLETSHMPIDSTQRRQIETAVISELKPILNLRSKGEAVAKVIEELRKRCVEEARLTVL